MNVKRLVAAAAVIVTLATLAAVGGGATTARSAEATPKRGGTFVFAIGADPQTLNPGITTGVEALAVDCKMFNGLLWFDRARTPHPELAQAWQTSKDGLHYTFKLRRDVKWHDGQPFTAADVQYTFEDVLRLYHPRAKAAFADVASVAAPDPYTVVVTMRRPYAPFLYQMDCQDAPILPRHLYQGTDVLKNPHDTDNPVGTGPFKFQSWSRGDRVTMVRNDAYFKKGEPYFDTAVAKIAPDPVSRVQGLRTGEIDYVQSFFLPKEQIATLRSDPKIALKTDTDVPGNYLLFFNVTHPPLDRAAVREALLRGLDRAQILQQAYLGIGYVSKSAVHQKLWAYDPKVDLTKLYPYDPSAAAKALDALGLKPGPKGTRFGFRLLYNVSQAGFTSTAQIIRDQWRKIGVDVTLEPFEEQVATDLMYNKRDFDGALQAYTTAGDPAVGIARAYVTIPPGHPFTNPTGYSNPRVDALFQQASTTVDLARRKALYDQLQVILARELPLIPLIDRTEIDAAQANLRGLWQSAQPYDEWGAVWRE